MPTQCPARSCTSSPTGSPRIGQKRCHGKNGAVAVQLQANEKVRFERIKELLEELGIYSDARAVTLLALSDDVTPNMFSTLAAAGLPLSAAARTSQIGDIAMKRLSLPKRLDREQRDYISPQLREVGLLDLAWVLSKAEAKKRGKLIEHGVHDPKSPNNSYCLTQEARALIIDTPASDWKRALKAFLKGSERRRIRVAQKQATVTVATTGGSAAKHSALIKAGVDAHLASWAADYELVFTDEADGARITARWQPKLNALGIRLGIDTVWPDAILANATKKLLWFVDAVETDGEITEGRADALRELAADAGFGVGGMTTVYETWKRAAGRQGAHKNLAVGSHFWVAEDGGHIYSVGSFAAAP